LALGQTQAAQDKFRVLLDSNDRIIHFHTGFAATQLARGDADGALATYENAIALFPRNVPLTIHYAEALYQNDEPGQAHEILLDLYNQVPPTPEQVRLIALAASAAGDVADAHYYMAEYHLLSGDLMMASDQLRCRTWIQCSKRASGHACNRSRNTCHDRRIANRPTAENGSDARQVAAAA
jgi:predicted Zn-dependent protease